MGLLKNVAKAARRGAQAKILPGGGYGGYGSGYGSDRFGYGSGFGTYGTRGIIDYAAEMGRPMDNSIVAACMSFIVDTWVESQEVVRRKKRSGEPTLEYDHILVKLLNNPNSDYDARLFREALIQDVKIAGTAFAQIIRDGYGIPSALYWLPTNLMKPRWNRGNWIDAWMYSGQGQSKPLDPNDVLVWREGKDDATGGRLGYSRFRSVLRETYGDNESAEMVNAFLRNRAQLGTIASPDGRYLTEMVKAGVNPQERGFDKDKAEALEGRLNAKSQGSQAGALHVFHYPVNVTQLQSALKDLDRRVQSDLSEERICAAFRIQPVCVQLGSGLRTSSDKHNIEFAYRMAWTNCLIPNQNGFAEVVNAKLLPEMDLKPNTAEFGYDRSQIAALREDQDALSSRVLSEWEDDAITHDEMRSELGLPIDPARKGMYYSQLKLETVAATETNTSRSVDPD